MKRAPAVCLLGCLGVWLSCVAARAQKIPELHARSLADTAVNLPGELNGRVAILVLGFSKPSSSQTKPWGDAILRDFGNDAHIAYYIMPVLAEVPGFVRGFVVESIRKQLPAAERNHFVPILKDPGPWKTLAALSSSNDAYIVVTDAQGQQQWRTHGALQPDVYNELRKRVKILEGTATANP